MNTFFEVSKVYFIGIAFFIFSPYANIKLCFLFSYENNLHTFIKVCRGRNILIKIDLLRFLFIVAGTNFVMLVFIWQIYMQVFY